MIQSLSVSMCLPLLIFALLHIYQLTYTPNATIPTTSPLSITDDSYRINQMPLDDNHNRKRRRDEVEDDQCIIIQDKEENNESEDEVEIVLRQPPKKKKKKSKAHSGRDLKIKNARKVKNRLKNHPNETFYDPGNGMLGCQACGKQMKPESTTVLRHLGMYRLKYIPHSIYFYIYIYSQLNE